jgi:hypothetical protein
VTGTTGDRDQPVVSPFNRRNFLASAAAVTTVSVGAAGPAPTARACEPPDGLAGGSVARMMAVPSAGRDVGWLRQALQIAVELELATLPPYLCGWWSIRDRGCEAARLIRRIIGDEMYHLGTVCNLLVAVGGRPRISAAALAYPGPLPGGVRAGVTVYLSGLTRDLVHDVMMAIEAPDDAPGRDVRTSPSIGDFYSALQQAFREAAPDLSPYGQLSAHIGSDVLKPVDSLDGAERSLEIIKEQGEGTTASPDVSFDNDRPAHYYAFAEIYHGRRLREAGGVWRYTGAPVPFPDARPMARLPAGGWPHPSPRVGRLLDRFDATYRDMLSALDRAWDGDGNPRVLHAAIHAMHGLELPAVELMESARPDAPGNYGPQFRPPFATCPS